MNLVPLNFFQLDPNTRDPYFQQWNVTLQKTVAGALSVEGAWVAAKGSKIEFSLPVNVPLPGPGNIQDRRLWPRFAAGSYVENGSYSSYHAFQMNVEVRAWHGLTWLSSYAFAKPLDNLSGDVQGFASQDPHNNNAEKGPSDYDVKHHYVARGTVESRTLARDFDPSAFRVPQQFTFGNSGRNILHRSGFRNRDFIVARNFPIKEALRLQFRGEFSNFTNTPAFGAPVANIQAGNAGQVLSAGDPRSIQLALKLIW